MNKKISIVMTSYNYSQYIAEAIESVQKQTYTDWELIIVDDGSKDDSVRVINRYAENDNRIKLIQNVTNRGLCYSLRRGIEEAGGEWITFLESDDIFSPNAVEEKLRAAGSGADIIFTDLEMFGDEEKVHNMEKYFFDVKDKFIKLDSSCFVDNIKTIIPQINIIPTFSVATVKRELLLACKFNPLCKASLDFYLWAQLSNKKFYYLNKKLTKWRIHKDSYINTYTHSWIRRYFFYATLYYYTVQDKNVVLRIILLLNYLRKRLIYLKLSKQKFKLNIGNGFFIWEKDF